mgnify:CR=1
QWPQYRRGRKPEPASRSTGSRHGQGDPVDVETGFWEARRRRRRRQKPAAGAKILAFFSVITPFWLCPDTCPDMS